MRNLKRALSLVMAMALIVGMMVVSASAASKDFTDADEIRHPEAVNTMVALNVISGKEDGSYFDPTGTLTRAEMAKIISYVMNGGVEPNIGTKVVPTYSDIDNHWAEAYIEYCTSMGIINGDGAGKFNPGGTLTASQAAKMFLTAMGYNAEVFGLVGNDWETNTNRYANEAGLYENLGNVSVSAPISRDDACQMAYNAIQSALMVRGWSQDMTTGNITERYELAVGDNGEPERTLLTERFGGKIFVGTFAGNTNTLTYSKDGYVKINGNLTTDDPDAKVKQAWMPYDLDIAGIGEEFKVIFKDGTGGKDGQPDEKDNIYGVFNTGATDVVTATRADVKDLKSDDAQINIGDVKYDVQTDIASTGDVTEGVTVITNYVGSGTAYTGNDLKGSSSANSKLTDALKAANGDTIKAVTDPDTGKITTVYITTSKIAAVTAINSEKVTMNNGVGTITIADNDVYDGIAKGDVVVATTLYAGKATDDGAYTIVEKAEVVSGSVTRYKGTESVTVDGTVYNIYGKTDMLGTIPDKTTTKAFDGEDIGESYDLYMVNGFVGAAVQTSESANNYSVVLEVKQDSTAGSAFSALQLQVMDAEGTKSVITVSDDSEKTASTDYAVGDIVVYTGDASNAVVTIKSTGTTGSYNDSAKTFGGVVTTADCVLFAETTDKTAGTGDNTYKVYNIRSLGDIPSGAAKVVKNDGRVVAIYMDLTGTPTGATSTTVYGIVTAYNGKVKIDGTEYHEYVAASNDDTYTLYFTDANNTTADLEAGDLISFDPSSDNTYGAAELPTKITASNSTGVYVKEYSEADGTLTYFTTVESSDDGYTGDVDTQKTLALDEDCAIVYVDADGDAAGDEIGINSFDSVTGEMNAAIVTDTKDGDQVIVAIFVETSGDCGIYE